MHFSLTNFNIGRGVMLHSMVDVAVVAFPGYDYVINHLYANNFTGIAQTVGEPVVFGTWTASAGRVVVYQNYSVGKMVDGSFQ